MDSLEELIKGKADQIDVAGHRKDSALAQEELDRFTDAGVVARVISTDGSTLVVAVASASQASNLRLQRIELLKSVSKALEREIDKMHIRIGSR